MPQETDETVLVHIAAAGVNPVDWKIREGYLKAAAPLTFPATLGGDFSGRIEKIGKNVHDFTPGDEVFGSALVLGSGSGAFAEYATVKQTVIARKPKKCSFVEAAVLPLVGVSAVQALEEMKLSRGQKILIHGGAGGIGSIAIQIAKHLGATVATTVSGGDKQFVTDLGADFVIEYQTQNFEKILHDFDAVYDTVGGQTYKNSFAVLKKGGVIVSMVEQPDKTLMDEYEVTAVSQFTKITTPRLLQVAQLVDDHVITVHIEKEFSIDDASKALEYQQKNHPKGKIALTLE
jgi:alcohol dehydrogenase